MNHQERDWKKGVEKYFQQNGKKAAHKGKEAKWEGITEPETELKNLSALNSSFATFVA